ncbi:ATP-binding protein [Geodermatophilus ruber]|uniref:Histidine kinase-like ATPase domain-containing protein n=1 Tax=Geodermatophilus ruber TaxID=504800 RepID=A0A1I4KQ71_9ACTN|nr:ATP-binding protein [Geodermatophilus ruber]SFL80763.1 Histidine kinase-like ATPase domain-containing protein [Geodermatophilus ruber]
MIRERAGRVWPFATPPPAGGGLLWELGDIAELPGMRAELRRHLSGAGPAGADPADLRDRLILALDEMASNALRHGGGGVRATVREAGAAYLVEVSDRAVTTPPTPAVDRDPSEGGLGLYLIAELATEHGWYVRAGTKYVWALLPR